MIKKIVIIFVSWKILVFVGAYLAQWLLPLKLQFTAFHHFGIHLPYWIWIWGNFDGYHYMEIAERGYRTLEQPFFPLFPILIKLTVVLMKLPYLIAGQIVSNSAFFVALVLLFKLCVLDGKKHLGSLLMLIAILFPTSFFYGAVYNDSLFLLFATMTLYYARKERWLLASFSAAFATLTRLNGLALTIYLITEYATSSRTIQESWGMRRLVQSKIYAIVLIPLSFLAYLLYVQVRFNDWRMVFTTMQIWDIGKVVFPLQTVWRYIKIIFLYPTFSLTYWVAVTELAFVLLYLFFILYSFKKIRFSYWILFVSSLFIPSLMGTFAGMPRYGLHLYPLFLAIALFLSQRNKPVKVLYFIICLFIFLYCIVLFTRGYFIA